MVDPVPWNHVRTISGNKSILLVWTWKNPSRVFSQKSRANVKYRNTLLTCFVPFLFKIFLPWVNVSECRTSVSERTHLMDLSSAVHSHAVTCVSAYVQLFLNEGQWHLNWPDIREWQCGQRWLSWLNWQILLSNVVVTAWAKELEHSWYEGHGVQREKESFSH